jgi:DNA-binding NtrC family response regulator
MSPSDPTPPSNAEAQRAFERDLARVAAGDVTVLLEGEHGVGKSRAARALHLASPRAGQVLVEVDLAALAPSLLEAELFGHEEGAFTGAHRARQGRFRRAHGGTLVLDGVEGLPRDVQGKLLRALQERQVEPLGGERPVPIDVRVVATSALDLGAEVKAGHFREDLFYRLAVVRLLVPPLRVRLEDLPGLARQLAAQVAKRAGVEGRELSEGALARLAAHPWPGNVRELENALERVTVLASGRGPVQAEELEFLGEATAGSAERLAAEALAHGLSLDRMSRAMLETALSGARGNLSAAARAVGLSRRAFEYRLGKLNSEASNGDDPEVQA